MSGFVNAAVRIDVSNMLDSSYGLLVVGKVTALAGLGVIGWRRRRSSIVALQRDPTARRPLLRLALTEAALFGVAIGVAVGLVAPPPPATREPLPAEVALGFDLAEPPTIAQVFFEWRFEEHPGDRRQLRRISQGSLGREGFARREAAACDAFSTALQLRRQTGRLLCEPQRQRCAIGSLQHP